jgi:hypothetical protein
LAILLLVLLSLFFVHCVACPSVPFNDIWTSKIMAKRK